MVALQQVRAVVEQPGVGKPRQRVHAAAPGDGCERAGEEIGAFLRGEAVRQVAQPAGLRELRRPDRVEREHVELGRARLQVDRVEEMLFVARRRQRGAPYVDARGALEAGEQRVERPRITEELGMAQDDGARRAPGVPLAAAAGERAERQRTERERHAPPATSEAQRELLGDSEHNGVLASFSPTFPGFYLYYPSRRNQPTKLKALIE